MTSIVMSSDVHHPQRMRASRKRRFSQLEPDNVPASKQPPQSLIPSPGPSVPDEPANVSEQSCRSSNAPPQSKSPSKRIHEDLSSDYTPPTKYPRLQSPASADNIGAWISETNTSPDRSQSCPPAVDTNASSVDSIEHHSVSLATIQKMSQQPLYAESQELGSSASQSGKPGTAHSLYRVSLRQNYVYMDHSGRKIPPQLREYTASILKRREAPQLDDDSVSKVIDTAEKLADSPEAPTLKLLRTAMFPLERPGIAEGGNTKWNTTALPRNPEYEYPLSAPKADAWAGYDLEDNGWTSEQTSVLVHPIARPYIKPAAGGVCPGFMVEMKAESTSGSLWQAENQAAGCGAHSVNALVWLFTEAQLRESSLLMDTISFSTVVSHRQAIFYVHWYSEDTRRFYMSYLKSYSTMEPEDVRGCCSTVENILDHLLVPRKTKISNALQALCPFPDHWKPAKRGSITTTSTAASSFSEETRSSKQPRRR